MAQFFTHKNGIPLSFQWGGLCTLLDIVLVDGWDLPAISSIEVESSERLLIRYAQDHKVEVLQEVTLGGLTLTSLNASFVVIAVPDSKTLILKTPPITESLFVQNATSKIAPLGYEKVFSQGSIKRVYRAKNPSIKHPYIRIDESIVSPDAVSGVYNSNYARSAMVGLLDSMSHVDDLATPSQLPYDPLEPNKNWSIVGTGATVMRGWAKWYYGTATSVQASLNESTTVPVSNAANMNWLIAGDADAFYFMPSLGATAANIGSMAYTLMGCGLFNSCIEDDTTPWFLMAPLRRAAANASLSYYSHDGAYPMMSTVGNPARAAYMHLRSLSYLEQGGHIAGTAVQLMNFSGVSTNNAGASNDVAAISIPITDGLQYLRGELRHVHYSLQAPLSDAIKPILSGSSRFVYLRARTFNNSSNPTGGFYFYLGDV